MSKFTDGNQAELLCGFSNKCPFPIIIPFLDHEEAITRPHPPHLLVFWFLNPKRINYRQTDKHA